MTSPDCLSSNNQYRPRLPSISRLNLAVTTDPATSDDAKKAASSAARTPTSTSPNMFYSPRPSGQPRYFQPNMFAYPRHPPPAPTLARRSIEVKPPEQDVLDKNYFRAFNLEERTPVLKNDVDSTKESGEISDVLMILPLSFLSRFT